MRARRVKFVVVLMLLVAVPAVAFNTFFMDKMPIGRMTAEDIDILMAAANSALDAQPDGATTHWRNEKTGANGDLTPRATYSEGGQRCRDMLVENSAGGLSNRVVLSMCKQADGVWKVMR